MTRVPPSEKTSDQIRKLLARGTTEEDPKSALVRLGMQRVIEEALEGAVRDLLGRGYYERRSEDSEGSRNGYRRGRMRTSEGEVGYQSPQVRDVDSAPLRAVREQLQGRTESLEVLALEMFARGCSTRDIEAIFRQPDGKSLLSRSAVSELTEALWVEYEDFATRDLSDLRPLYLFLDGVAERLRPGAKREAILCAWALSWEGEKILIHVAPGTKESTDCCLSFLENLKARGLRDPVLVITDGAPGLIRAVETVFPACLRQRCLAHKMRNLLGKLPEDVRSEFKYLARAAYQAPSPAMAQTVREDLVMRYKSRFPTAVRCFEEDFAACTAYLYCPLPHHPLIRTTNLLERLFREERRRTRAVGTFFGEKPVLKLMYAALIRASESWHGLRLDPFTQRQLERLQAQLKEQFRRENAPIVQIDDEVSAPIPFYSTFRT